MITRTKMLSLSGLAAAMLLVLLLQLKGICLSADGTEPAGAANVDANADGPPANAKKQRPADGPPDPTNSNKKSSKKPKVFRTDPQRATDVEPTEGENSPGKDGPGGLPGSTGGTSNRGIMPGMPGIPGAMGMGSGMPGMPGVNRTPGATKGTQRFVQGIHAHISWNEAGDTLWGYSDTLGKWTKLSIPKATEPLKPIVSAKVAFVASDGKLYAYSSTTGRWGVLEAKGNWSVDAVKVVSNEQGKIHIFSDVTGRWSSTDDSPEVIASPVSSDSPALEPATAEPARTKLVDDRGRKIVLGAVDRDGDLDVLVPETSERVSAADLLDSLKARSAEAERTVAQLATEYRQALAQSGDNAPTATATKSRLSTAVAEAFERRQQAQRLEAEILRVKLQRVDARLLERERSKNGIVARRVEELGNSSGPAEAPKQSTEPPAAPSSEVPGANAGENERFPRYVPRGQGTRTVGVVSRVADRRIFLSPQEPHGIHVGDELEVSRPDFVHEDGTQQYYSFARLFVVEAHEDSAVACIVEIAATLTDKKYVNEEITAGQMVGVAIEALEKRPEMLQPLLVPLQGRWRCQRWVENGRVLPPGDLKGTRHALFIDGDRFTIVDLSAGRILGRTEIRFVQVSTRPGATPQFTMGSRIAVAPRAPGGRGYSERIRGAYEVTDQTLRICVMPSGYQGDPSDFEAGPDRTLWEFVRENSTVGDDSRK